VGQLSKLLDQQVTPVSYRSSVAKFTDFSPRLFQSWNDNFPDLMETITLLHKCQKWYTIS